ncbi:restriction endonuclease subunit S [Kaistella anthropi]|nr:restriction endonuclease subunit S [Kaistella anthropi]
MEKKLPKNWVETELGKVSEIIRGVSYNKNQALSFRNEDSAYILRGGNIQDGKIDFDTDDNVFVDKKLVNPIQFLKENDVVIVGSTGSKKLIGKAGVAIQDYDSVAFGAFLMLLRTKSINKKFHAYFFQTKFYRNLISELAGGVNINNIRKEYLENMAFPLPPLPEQERIVAKLDLLFAQHEKMKTSLEKIPQLLKDFRQQILTQAVTGKLTEEWRKGKELGEWEERQLQNVGQFISGFAFKSNDFEKEGIQLIRMGNLYNNKLDLARSPVFIPKNYDAKILKNI